MPGKRLPGGEDEHDVTAGQGGETLVVAVLVQPAHLIRKYTIYARSI